MVVSISSVIVVKLPFPTSFDDVTGKVISLIKDETRVVAPVTDRMEEVG